MRRDRQIAATALAGWLFAWIWHSGHGWFDPSQNTNGATASINEARLEIAAALERGLAPRPVTWLLPSSEDLRGRVISSYGAAERTGIHQAGCRRFVLDLERGMTTDEDACRAEGALAWRLVESAYGPSSVPADRYARWADSVFGGWTADRLVIRFAERNGLRGVEAERKKAAAVRYRSRAIEAAFLRSVVLGVVLSGLFALRVGAPPIDTYVSDRYGRNLVLLFVAGTTGSAAAFTILESPVATSVSMGIAVAIWAGMTARDRMPIARPPTRVREVIRCSLGLASVMFLVNSVVDYSMPGAGGFLSKDVVARIVATPILEEVLFRGCLLRGLRSIFISPIAVGVSALAFALIHSPSQFLLALATGLVAAWGYGRWGRLLPCIAAHSFWNFTALSNWWL